MKIRPNFTKNDSTMVNSMSINFKGLLNGAIAKGNDPDTIQTYRDVIERLDQLVTMINASPLAGEAGTLLEFFAFKGRLGMMDETDEVIGGFIGKAIDAAAALGLTGSLFPSRQEMTWDGTTLTLTAYEVFTGQSDDGVEEITTIAEAEAVMKRQAAATNLDTIREAVESRMEEIRRKAH